MLVASFYAPRFEKWSGCDYDRLLQLVDASCRRVGRRHVVISDSERPGLDTAVFDLPENLMAALLDGQRQLLAATPGPVLLIGADCLMTRDPRPYLAGDITITTSPTFSDCEMNTGAIWCADGPTCAPVWQAAVDRGPREWGEDQVALYGAIRDAEAAGTLNVERLRCEQHNWAPSHLADPAGMPTVVHFRGRRKAWMAEWASRFLGIAA
jgi:hypothetical protein